MKEMSEEFAEAIWRAGWGVDQSFDSCYTVWKQYANGTEVSFVLSPTEPESYADQILDECKKHLSIEAVERDGDFVCENSYYVVKSFEELASAVKLASMRGLADKKPKACAPKSKGKCASKCTKPMVKSIPKKPAKKPASKDCKPKAKKIATKRK